MPFLAFEGLDGSGKTTLILGLEDALRARGIEAVVTREPGGTALGEELRIVLLRTGGETPVARAEALLYQAGRAQHVERKIRPALESGRWVLSDRFAASSLAFQGDGRDLGRGEIEWLNAFATRGLKPDLYILLDLTVDGGRRRRLARGGAADRIEGEDPKFFERVRAAYLDMAAAEPARWLVIPADVERARVLELALEGLKARRWLD